MADTQPEKGFVRLANDLWKELIRRNFTKRQKDILLFIWRMSYGCNLKVAYIPKLKDFEICGVPATHIKNELKHLESAKVINWDREEKLFSINKDYDLWQITPVMGWETERFNALIHLNIKRKTSQNVNFSVLEQEDETSQNVNQDFTKHEVIEEENFTKHEVEGASNPCGCKAEEVPKDSSFKNIIKDSSNSCCLKEDSIMNQGSQNEIKPDSQDAVPAGDADSNRKAAELDYRNTVTSRYLDRKGSGLIITIKDEAFISELIADGVPLTIALEGINQSFDKFKPKHKKDSIKSLSYCEGAIYGLLAKQEDKSSDPVVLEESVPEISQDEYRKTLEKLKAKRGVEA
ncbi:replication protein [Paenibacillus tritici]|uniref:replication protein n=1 Tax=Paenibacillus tritici TaxID=1873425 RepID=UPI001BAB2506|nr:replication protein [Paenibacillus tritici]QUL57533.1 replication protein [Paenibacillus tritici]